MSLKPISMERQIVAMHLGSEVYGIDIAHIDTVITPQAITPVPQTPDYIHGVMNLRGRILPVLDLRTRFKIEPRSDDADYRIIVVEVEGLCAGLIVDSVSEVLRLSSAQIQPPSDLLKQAEQDVIVGIGRVPVQGSRSGEECFILLLDVQKALTTATFGASEIAELQEAA